LAGLYGRPSQRWSQSDLRTTSRSATRLRARDALRPVRAENPVHGYDQQGCLPRRLTVTITGHVPAVRLPSHHASDHVAAASPAPGDVEDRRNLAPAPPARRPATTAAAPHERELGGQGPPRRLGTRGPHVLLDRHKSGSWCPRSASSGTATPQTRSGRRFIKHSLKDLYTPEITSSRVPASRQMPATSVHRPFRPPVDPSGNGVVRAAVLRFWWSGFIRLGVRSCPLDANLCGAGR